MSAESTVAFFGFLVAITPFLGLPSSWYPYIFPVLGILTFGTGMFLRTRRIRVAQLAAESASQTETESVEQDENILQETNDATHHDPSPIA